MTLNTNLGALGLLFETTGYTMSGSGTLSLGTGGISAGGLTSGTTTLSAALSLVGAQTWNFGNGSALSVTNMVANGGNTLTLAGPGAYSLGGVIAGSGGLTKIGTGTVTIGAASTYNGATVLGTTGSLASAGTFTFTSATGSINNSSSITVNGTGTVLSVSNSALTTTASQVNRINDNAPLTLNYGGEVSMNGSNTASVNLSETIGSLNLGTGAGTVTASEGASSVFTLAAGSFSRTNNSTGLIRGTNLGLTAAASHINITLASTSGLTQIGTSTSTTGAEGTTKNLTIIPYLLGATSAGSTGTEFVTYDTSSGFRRLAVAEQSLVTAGATGDNVYAAAGGNAVTGAKTFNSLLLNAGGTSATPGTTASTVTGDGNSLTLTSGALANVATGTDGTATVSGFGSIIFGTTKSNEAIITNTNTSGTLTISSPINTFAAGGGLTTAGAGTVILGAANLYTGQTTVNAGTLQLGTGGTAGSLGSNTANIVLNGGTIAVNRSDAVTLSNNISGVGGFTQAGAGTTTLNGTNSYAGGTTVSAGTLQAGSASAFGSTTAPVAVSGGTLDLTTFSFTTGALTLSSGTIQSTGSTTASLTSTTYALTNTGTVSVILAGTGALTKSGTGTAVLNAANTYTGTTAVTGGTLQAGAANAFGSNSPVNLSNTAGVTLDLNGFNQTIGSLAGGGTTGGNVTLGGGNLTFGGNNATTTFTGTISGTGGVTKTGVAPMTLAGVLSQTGGLTINAGSGTVTINNSANTNTYTGATSVNAFVDVSNKPSAFGATGAGNGTTVNTGGTVRFRDFTTGQTVAEAITLNGGSFFSYSDVGTITFSGQFTLNTNGGIQITPQTQVSTTTVFSGGFVEGGSGSNLTFARVSAAGTASSDMVSLTGASTYGGATYITDALTTNTGAFSVRLSGGDNRLPTGTIVTLGGNVSGFGAAAGNGRLILGDATAGASSQTIAGLTTNGTGTGNAVVGGASAVSTLTVNNAANYTYSGLLGGTATNANNLALTKIGSGTLALTGANTYSGGTMIGAGQLTVGNTTALGSATGALTVNGGTLDLTTFSPTVGAVTLSGGTIQSTGSTTASLAGTSYALTNTGTVSAVLAGTGALTKTGAGTATLTGANTYTGTTTVNNGTLNIGGSAATGSISTSSALALGGGLVNYTRTGTNTQTFASTAVNSGASGVTSAATGDTVALNGITRSVGGTMAFNGPGAITTTTTNGSGNILGGYATYGTSDWATVSGGNITAFSGYAEYNNVAGWNNVSGQDLTDGLGTGGPGYNGTSTNSVTINSLRFNEGNADSIVNVNGGNNLTISSGGILVTPNLGVRYARINGGALTTTGADLVVQQNNAAGNGHLQIGSSIFGSIGLTKSGTGVLDLNGFDATYTGATTINSGTVNLAAGMTATSSVTLNNSGTLVLAANDRINDSATVTLNGGTLNTGGFQEGRATGTSTATQGLGALTLTNNSILDFGAGHSGSSVLAFAASNTQSWTGTLALSNFVVGTDELNFASSTGLTVTQLGEISLNGFTATGLDSFGDVLFTAVPEPATWAAGFLTLGVAGWHFRRRSVRRKA